MKPIEIKLSGSLPQSAPEICAALLETERWPEFTGSGFLPGIASAHFEVRTPEILGSRIRVRNTDGSSHLEEIIAWDPERQVVLRFGDFQPPLKHLATHFIETWRFVPAGHGVHATRMMAFYPKGLFGWLMLLPIAQLMKKAFAAELERQAQKQNRPERFSQVK